MPQTTMVAALALAVALHTAAPLAQAAAGGSKHRHKGDVRRKVSKVSKGVALGNGLPAGLQPGGTLQLPYGRGPVLEPADALRERAMALTAPLVTLAVDARGEDAAVRPNFSPAVRRPGADDLPGLLARRQLRVLTVAPADAGDADASSRRLDQDVTRELARHLERLGRIPAHSGGSSIRAQVIAVPESMLVPSLLGGLGDVALARPGQLRANKLLDVSHPLVAGPSQIVVGNDFSTPVHGLRDLSGRKLLVRAGSRQKALLAELNVRLARVGMAPATLVEADGLATDEDILDMVAGGYADLTVVPEPLARAWKRRSPTLRTFPQAALEQGGSVVFLTRAGSPQLHQGLERFVAERRKDSHRPAPSRTARYTAAFAGRDPLAPGDYGRFFRYAPLFRKHAARYDLDWLLLAALCYQESSFGKEGTSHRGAMGLMQIMPATARSAGLGDPFSSDDANVQAGAKYLAYLRNMYERKDGLARAEATRFAIAAYNAGPNKIQQVRQLASRMGLDPNRWHGHCEMAAQRIIGQETTVTVSRVMKYRLVYQLALGRDGQRAKPALVAENNRRAAVR